MRRAVERAVERAMWQEKAKGAAPEDIMAAAIMASASEWKKRLSCLGGGCE